MKNGKKTIKWVKPSLKGIYIQHNEKAGLDCTSGSIGNLSCISGVSATGGLCNDGTAANGCVSFGSTAINKCSTGGSGPP